MEDFGLLGLDPECVDSDPERERQVGINYGASLTARSR